MNTNRKTILPDCASVKKQIPITKTRIPITLAILSLCAATAEAATLTEDFDSGLLPATLTVFGPSVDVSSGYAYFYGTDYFERTYLKTVATDYFNQDFVAEVTLTAGDGIAFFGMGSPDPLEVSWFEPGAPTIGLRMHSDYIGSGRSDWQDANSMEDISSFTFGNSGSGTHRLRLTWDATARTATFDVDENYSGGAFASDITSGPLNGADNGFSDVNTPIYFGSSEYAQFDNLSIATIPEPNTALAGLGVFALAIHIRRRRV